MNSALLDHNTPEQVLHHVVNDPNISLADFRALTLAVVGLRAQAAAARVDKNE